LVQLLTFGGFIGGLALGALIAGAVSPSIHTQTPRTVVTLLLVVGPAIILGVAGRTVGVWSNAAVRRLHLGGADAVLGVAVASVAVLLSAWLLANVLSQSRYTWLSSQIQRSDVLRAVDHVMPPVPGVISRVQAFLAGTGFPSVFAQFEPPTAPPVAVPTPGGAQGLAARAAASTVKVQGVACGYLQEGSAFAVAPGVVVTNAHVVAGESSTQVVVNGTTYGATTIYYDPTFDLALLRTRAPIGPPLHLAPQEVARGTQGAIVGYPHNGGLTIGPAGVAATLSAEGRDIYNENEVVRDVYEVDADVEPGNSGGPLVGADGSVIGVVFSRSTVVNDVGYALTSPGVLSRVQPNETRTSPVSTGACVPG
jgi:S1-C subfamily serine protease